MNKHTPGPWASDLVEVYCVRAQQDGGRVALMTNLKGQFGLAGRRDANEVAANALLISAAPDLLEALTAIVDNGLSSSRIANARAAIAKATGEQP